MTLTHSHGDGPLCQVEVLEFDADTDTLRRVASYWHKPEVWAIAPCPEDARLLITVHNTGANAVPVWHITCAFGRQVKVDGCMLESCQWTSCRSIRDTQSL